MYLIENGAFEDIDLAMMVDPDPATIICPNILARVQILATYTGLTAHIRSPTADEANLESARDFQRRWSQAQHHS